MKKYFFAVILSQCFLSTYSQYRMIIGTYTGSGSYGIYLQGLGINKKDVFIYGKKDSIYASNPSYLTLVNNDSDKIYQRRLYAVNENTIGGVTAFSFNRFLGRLDSVSSQSSNGKHPCYIAADKTRKWLAVGNYSSGNFSIIPINNNGSLGIASATIQHTGSSINAQRQGSAHVHAVVFSPDNRFLLVTDLGTDKISTYHFNESDGTVSLAHEQVIAAGSGPRHLVFHPNKKYVYLLNEINSTVNVFRYQSENGALVQLQTLSSLPKEFKGFGGSADIHVSADGKFLYASNRGEANNIAVYKIKRKSGKLVNIGFSDVQGKAPRNFSIDPTGGYLFCANQDSNEIVIFKRNKRTGLLTDTGKRISVPKPVSIQWAKMFK